MLDPNPEDLEEEAIQQQPKASYESVSETHQESDDKTPIVLPYHDNDVVLDLSVDDDKEPIAVEVSEEDVSEINSS